MQSQIKQRLFVTFILAASLAQAQDFNGARMVSENTIWGFTRGGVYLSQDRARSWNQVTPAFTEKVQALQGFALDENRAWVTAQLDGKVLLAFTQDAGQNWTQMKMADVGQGAWVKFRDPQNGIGLIGMDAGMSHQAFILLKTSNGGITWQKVNSSQNSYFQMPELQGGTLPDICCFTDAVFLTDKNVLVTGGYTPTEKPYFFRSNNGGKSFSAANSLLPLNATERKSFSRLEIPYAKGDVVLMAGVFSTPEQPSYLVTFLSQDGGKSWVRGEKLNPRSQPQLTQVVFTDAKNGFTWLGGKLYMTSTAGQTWHQIVVPFENAAGFKQISFADPKNGMALLDTALWITSDGGASWQEIKR
ncbi:sialidase family protein [Deinococcus roseus]|uniref:Photosynthesis system II assembly factor Ycf48/Hcf136-like domain-containing protein n=1 Tax=Deinococcus roseus TaxID=392414 RepID=A0ABQ2D1L5_9DEIO|nr:hypothetical protein [Deinococcus roseus]GGJ37787.1 hypothetical protein GCM10008938_24860 [Deinococcus roseus]